MVAPWIAPVAKSALSIWQVIATVATSIAVPPLAPVVSGIFTIAGTALDAGLKGASQAETMTQEQYVRESLNFALESLDDMNGTLYDMKDSLGEMNGTMIGMKVKLENVNDALKELNGSMIGIQQFLKETAEENRMTLRDIQLTLKSFEENMNRNFDELMNFMIVKDFVEKIQLPMKSLWKLMQDASDSQTVDSIDRFISKYKAHPARTILSEFIDRLDYSHTNPISSAMENHVFESRQIMDHYVQLLSHLVFKVLAIEGFYFGLSDIPKSSYPGYMDRLSRDVDNAISSFRKFYTSYKIPKEKYWPDAINKTILSKNDESHDLSKIADKIKDTLNGIHTADVFSIYVYTTRFFNTGFPLVKFDRHVLGDMTNKMAPFMVVKVGLTMVIILRSEKFHEISPQSFSLLRRTFRSFAAVMKRVDRKHCHDMYDEKTDIGNDLFLEVLNEQFTPNIVTGFVACFYNEPILSRYTNNGSSILTEEDKKIIKTYYALSWA